TAAPTARSATDPTGRGRGPGGGRRAAAAGPARTARPSASHRGPPAPDSRALESSGELELGAGPGAEHHRRDRGPARVGLDLRQPRLDLLAPAAARGRLDPARPDRGRDEPSPPAPRRDRGRDRRPLVAARDDARRGHRAPALVALLLQRTPHG